MSFSSEIGKEMLRKHLSRWPLYSAEDDIYCMITPSGMIAMGYINGFTANLCKRFDINIDRGVCYLLAISIEKEHRGKGLGAQLYRIVEDIARELGCSRVEMMPSGSTMTGESRADYLVRHGYKMVNGNARKELCDATGHGCRIQLLPTPGVSASLSGAEGVRDSARYSV